MRSCSSKAVPPVGPAFDIAKVTGERNSRYFKDLPEEGLEDPVDQEPFMFRAVSAEQKCQVRQRKRWGVSWVAQICTQFTTCVLAK